MALEGILVPVCMGAVNSPLHENWECAEKSQGRCEKPLVGPRTGKKAAGKAPEAGDMVEYH